MTPENQYIILLWVGIVGSLFAAVIIGGGAKLGNGFVVGAGILPGILSIVAIVYSLVMMSS